MTLDELAKSVSRLASTRREVELIDAELNAAYDTLHASRPWLRAQELKAKLEEAKESRARQEGFVRASAVAVFRQSGNKRPHQAVSVREYLTVVIEDEERVFRYALSDLTAILSLDITAVKKTAKMIDIPGTDIVREPRGLIASDLSAWLPEGE